MKKPWFAHLRGAWALFSGNGGRPPHILGPRCQRGPALSKGCRARQAAACALLSSSGGVSAALSPPRIRAGLAAPSLEGGRCGVVGCLSRGLEGLCSHC